MKIGRMFQRDGIWYEFLGYSGQDRMLVRRPGSLEILVLPIDLNKASAIPPATRAKAASRGTEAKPPPPSRKQTVDRVPLNDSLADPRKGIYRHEREQVRQQEDERIRAEAEELMRTHPSLR